MATSQKEKLVELETFLKDHPQIKLATTSSPDYAALRDIFCLDNNEVPFAIVRPQSVNDVSLLVQFAKSKEIKFVVRTGGHSLFGHSQVEDALTIDMRDITYVRVQDGKSSAKVGGGTLQVDLAANLSTEGLATPIGTVSSVGYVGWAAYGGYGPFSAHFGLGVDQILSATVVNWKGEVVEADETLIKGIRGAGGVFGIIVEVTIKVYPLPTVCPSI
jgi:FAD/FMN-containing dehydrogenase